MLRWFPLNLKNGTHFFFKFKGKALGTRLLSAGPKAEADNTYWHFAFDYLVIC